MDQLYRSYLNKAENIYYLTDKDNLTYSQIDTLYNQLRKLRKTLLENTGDLEDYQNAENQFTDLSAQLENRWQTGSFHSAKIPVSSQETTGHLL